MVFKYNILYCIEFYKGNKEVIDGYIKGDLCEGYKTYVQDDEKNTSINNLISNIFGTSVALGIEEALKFVVFFLIFTIISFFISLTLLIKNWKSLSTIVKVFGILFLLTPFPLLTTVIIFISIKPNNI